MNKQNAEKALLGALLLEGKGFENVADMSTDYFDSIGMAQLFALIKDLHRRNQHYDAVSVAEFIMEMDAVAEPGVMYVTAEDVIDIAASVPCAANVSKYADGVRFGRHAATH